MVFRSELSIKRSILFDSIIACSTREWIEPIVRYVVGICCSQAVPHCPLYFCLVLSLIIFFSAKMRTKQQHQKPLTFIQFECQNNSVTVCHNSWSISHIDESLWINIKVLDDKNTIESTHIKKLCRFSRCRRRWHGCHHWECIGSTFQEL